MPQTATPIAAHHDTCNCALMNPACQLCFILAYGYDHQTEAQRQAIDVFWKALEDAPDDLNGTGYKAMVAAGLPEWGKPMEVASIDQHTKQD